MDINHVVLVGRLTSGVDLKYTPSGVAIAKFNLAVNEKPVNNQEQVSFFPVVCWGKTAENCATFLIKGQQVAVSGRLKQRRWKTQDGQNRNAIEVIGERVTFLQKPGNKAPSGSTTKQNHSEAPDSFYNDMDYGSPPMDSTDYDNSETVY